MDYRFRNFQFDSRSLLLTMDGQSVPIRNNEARLLAFFLANPRQVFSKNQILENVWAGKVVSEQVVFQTVSNLRTLFGEGAIKTFPKKGYQWLIPLAAATEKDLITVERQVNTKRTFFWLLAFVSAVAIAIIVGRSFHGAVASNLPIIVIQPFAADGINTANRNAAEAVHTALFTKVNAQSLVKVQLPPDNNTALQVEAAPSYFYSRYVKSVNADLLVTGRIRLHEDIFYASFLLQGKENNFTIYLTAATASAMAEELAALLGTLASKPFLWESKDQRLVSAQLQLLYSEEQDNLAMLHQLTVNFLNIGETQKARILALELEQRAKVAQHIPYQALALLAQADAIFDPENTGMSFNLLDAAQFLAAKIGDHWLQSYVLERYAAIYYHRNDFSSLEAVSLRALAHAEKANAAAQQTHILRRLSIFSFKLNQKEKSIVYLAQAQSILDEHEFPGESYALLEDIFGMYAENPMQQEQFYWQALNRFAPTQEAWVKERAQEHLIYLYIEQQRWGEALSVFSKETSLSGAELMMIADIHFYENNYALAQQKAEEAFKQSNLSGEHYSALKAALMLALLHKQFARMDEHKEYRKFINGNATELWKNQNAEALLEIEAGLD